jgi:phosphoribosylformylglycinamidine synthase
VACAPYAGTVEAVLECAANLACVGAQPLGLTNCLNFGNPEKPHIAWQLSESVRGLADACRALGVPVVGGNVSLYNEGAEGPIYPTPVVGMVGTLPDPARAAGSGFREEGHAIALVGAFMPALAGSELAKLTGQPLASLRDVDLAVHAQTLAFVRDAVRSGRLASAHDVSDGGIAVALAESCIAGGLGARVSWAAAQVAEPGEAEAVLFGEGPGGFVVSGPPEALDQLAAEAGPVPFVRLGEVRGDQLEMTASAATLSLPIEALGSVFERAIPDLLS